MTYEVRFNNPDNGPDIYAQVDADDGFTAIAHARAANPAMRRWRVTASPIDPPTTSGACPL